MTRNKRFFRTAVIACVAAVAGLVATLNFAPAADAAGKFITIGTGGVTGVYYPAGGAICRLVNRGRREHGIRCSVESTGGSVYNLNALRGGELDITVAQSDWQYHAYKGTGVFKDFGQMEKLRALFSLHSEPFTVVARADAGVNTLDDLVGKRVNIGNAGSGMRATMEVLMEQKGWTKESFKLASELKASEQAQALCDNKIDVMVYSAGHPNGAVQEVTTSCPSKLIPVNDDDVKALVEKYPFYALAVIPGGMYQGNPDDVPTFGVKATFVSTTDLDDDTVYTVVKSVFDNFENFKTLHPVFSTLDPKQMVSEGNTAPLHPGAVRYFKEKGLM
ncbi:MAG: TAXI family TRAP transporter solute-binding subunit [Rickettsiales bacterium]|nr:TAXI family TRAP transporter solute-binding subunit [Rickettsiales bacterium]